MAARHPRHGPAKIEHHRSSRRVCSSLRPQGAIRSFSLPSNSIETLVRTLIGRKRRRAEAVASTPNCAATSDGASGGAGGFPSSLRDQTPPSESGEPVTPGATTQPARRRNGDPCPGHLKRLERRGARFDLSRCRDTLRLSEGHKQETSVGQGTSSDAHHGSIAAREFVLAGYPVGLRSFGLTSRPRRGPHPPQGPAVGGRRGRWTLVV